MQQTAQIQKGQIVKIVGGYYYGMIGQVSRIGNYNGKLMALVSFYASKAPVLVDMNSLYAIQQGAPITA